jgi:hypothetical protein
MALPEAEANRKPKRPKRLRRKITPLSVPLILSWVDDHHQRIGNYPKRLDGVVLAAPHEDWLNVDQALRKGLRSLPKGSSLAKLLRDHRLDRHPRLPPPLSEDLIVRWAQLHYRTHGDWPTQHSGTVDNQPAETWAGIDRALRVGCRGFPGGDSLAKLLQRRLGVRNMAALPRLSDDLIVAWADDHHARRGDWPTLSSGPVAAAPEETWKQIDDALRGGYRGLPGGSSLGQLLHARRGKRLARLIPKLTEAQVVAWARAHYARTGKWPTKKSGAIPDTQDTWCAVNIALHRGKRGLPGGDTLSRLLARHGCGGGA